MIFPSTRAGAIDFIIQTRKERKKGENIETNIERKKDIERELYIKKF